MKKIKLVVSDLHLGNGKYLEQGETNSLEEFRYDEKFSEFLNYYSTGNFEGAEVELILNGDILNFLQVDFRGHHLTTITESISLEKLKYIVKGHDLFFSSLREFLKDPKHSVAYVVGNHDQEMLWPSCRSYMNQVLETTVRYKNIVYYFDGIHIEHGHMHEAANRIDPKKFFIKRNVPETVLNLPFGSIFFLDYVLKVKKEDPYIDKVRPFSAFIRWGLLNRTIFTLKNMVSLFVFFLRITFTKGKRQRWSWRQTLEIFLEGAIFPELSQAARKILSDDRVHTVVFGHSHVYQYRKWDDNSEYLNTGTWTDLTSLDVTSMGKITKLTYALIEYPPGESGARPRGRLKEWRGYHRIEEDVDAA